MGDKWCYGCKATHPTSAFARDASRYDGLTAACREWRNSRQRELYKPKPGLRFGPLPIPARDGDVKQARRSVNHLVEIGRLPAPNSLPCVDCGHAYAPGERRHEYDHFRGYGAAHHLDVEPVCKACHVRREMARRAA